MSILDKFTDQFKKKSHAPKLPKAAADEDASAKKPVAKKADAPKKADEAKSEVTQASAGAEASRYANVLIKPHVSEKAAHLAGRGIYVFDVPLSANKIEVRKAVEALYKVEVTSVRTQRGIGKLISRGRIFGSRNDWKKALVELKKGQTINLVEGV
jgi:large subunit ribosomal protein L23